MRLRAPVLALALALSAAAVPASSAQAPARAHAEARVAAGDLGTAGRVIADGDARRAVRAGADELGLQVAAGGAVARTARTDGEGVAEAEAVARGIVLLGGLVTARRAERRAVAADGDVAHAGAVRGLVVAGQPIGDVDAPAAYTVDGAEVTVNSGEAALSVTLSADRDGFASGTTVSVAAVRADAADGADPAATPVPVPTPTPAPAATPDPAPATSGDGIARRRRPDPARRLARGRYAFPIYGDARVADDFGAPRRLTGNHQGNDVFAPFGAPVLAVADGTVDKVGTLPISGNRLWLRTNRGDDFFYAHLSAFAPDAVEGRRVKAGTLLGFVGNTGDAEPTPPHVHFQIHPRGERRPPIDPHRVLLAWQRDGIVPTGGWLARYGDEDAAPPGALVEVRDFIAGG